MENKEFDYSGRVYGGFPMLAVVLVVIPLLTVLSVLEAFNGYIGLPLWLPIVGAVVL